MIVRPALLSQVNQLRQLWERGGDGGGLREGQALSADDLRKMMGDRGIGDI